MDLGSQIFLVTNARRRTAFLRNQNCLCGGGGVYSKSRLSQTSAPATDFDLERMKGWGEREEEKAKRHTGCLLDPQTL